MKRIYILFSFLVIATLVFGNYKTVALASTQLTSVNTQNRDLCRGTGGNGQIVSKDSNSFTLERNDRRTLVVNLTDHATIEAPTGFVTVSDLHAGDRVTLIGDDNEDGTFTADAIVLCNSQGFNKGKASPHTLRAENTDYKNVSSVIKALTVGFFGLLWFCLSAFLRIKKKKSYVSLFFFTIFYIYLFKVLDYTLLQFQSLLLLQYFVPDLILNGVDAGKSANFTPLITLRVEDMNTSLLNILMMLPLGFGLPFISHFRFNKVVIAGLLFSFIIELLQFITGFFTNTTFRITDINDLIFNTLGVAIGYVLFTAFVRIYHRVFRDSKALKNPLLRYIAERPQTNKYQ